MCSKTIPGTVLMGSGDIKKDIASIFSPVTAVTGFTLSQVTQITGLSAPTIQNWVKRGWVSNPQDKRYSDLQLARILIINLLKDSFQLEQIVKLMSYLNGKVNDQADDAMAETELYSHLCVLIGKSGEKGNFTEKDIQSIISAEFKDYKPLVPEGKEKLLKTLYIMLFSYHSAELKRKAESMYNKICNESIS